MAPGRTNRQTARPTRATPESGAEELNVGANDSIRIIADTVNNALLIMASPRTYRQVEAAIKKLDIVPLQVLIEATIAEVTLNDELRYGVQWFFQFGSSEITLTEGASTAIAPVFPGFSYFFRGADRQVVLSALDSVTDVKVISSPQLMVQDNRTAELQVGDQVPVATQSAVSTIDPAAPIVNSIQFRDTGVVLRVTPRINAGGLVDLDIEQEVSDVVTTTTSGIDSPTIQQRRVSSSVVVQNGETIALGGMIRDSRSEGKSGVPLLSSIPILGSLFGTTENTLDRTELLILITPRVVSNFEEARSVTEQLKRRIRSIFPDAKKEEKSAVEAE